MHRRLACISSFGVLLIAVNAAMAVPPADPARDEARIEELLRAERAKAGPATAAPAAQGQNAEASGDTPVIAAAVAAPHVKSENDTWLSPEPVTDGMAFEDLAGSVGRPVLVVTEGNRKHRGIVQSANAREVVLKVKRGAGVASYAIPRGQVVRVDPLF